MPEPRGVGLGEKVGLASFHLPALTQVTKKENSLGGLLIQRSVTLPPCCLNP